MIMTIIRNTITSIVLITVGYAAAPTTVQKVIGKKWGRGGNKKTIQLLSQFSKSRSLECVYTLVWVVL